MALPTKGRVIISTTQGEIDVELWSKETPKTCRNFLALAMEGYYDGCIFHRVVPGFLVQTGDKTGTGLGGESFYGDPFEDEIHPRLRFSYRGIVAMANKGTKNSNDSQFFITLDRADELHGKHTLFGRVVGDTVYNVMKIGEQELGENERPIYPPKIKSIRIVDNPFDDIVPRITAAERRAQKKAMEDAQKEREEEMRRRGAKKNVKLLSFAGDDEEESGGFKKKAIVRPDLVDDSTAIPIPEFVKEPSASAAPKPKPSKEEKQKDDGPDSTKTREKSKDDGPDLTKIREKHAKERSESSTSRSKEIAKMEARIRGLNPSSSDEEGPSKKKAKKSYLQEELSKYSKGLGLHSKRKPRGDVGMGEKRVRDEGDVLEMMSAFRGRLKGTVMDEEMEPAEDADAENAGEQPIVPTEDLGMELDTDFTFLSHSLNFPKGNEEEVRKAERDYEVIDPRARGQRARDEERERKRVEKMSGRKGRR